MAGAIARELKQHRAFSSLDQEVLLGLQIVATRVMEPWEKFLKANAGLTPHQYNVLRILRGSHPTMRVVLMTGYSDESDAAMREGFVVLDKPCSPADVWAAIVRRVDPEPT